LNIAMISLVGFPSFEHDKFSPSVAEAYRLSVFRKATELTRLRTEMERDNFQ